jgi:hypothetical protein
MQPLGAARAARLVVSGVLKCCARQAHELASSDGQTGTVRSRCEAAREPAQQPRRKQPPALPRPQSADSLPRPLCGSISGLGDLPTKRRRQLSAQQQELKTRRMMRAPAEPEAMIQETPHRRCMVRACHAAEYPSLAQPRSTTRQRPSPQRQRNII